MKRVKYPKDLAAIVFSELKRLNFDFPGQELLSLLFETMYFASIKTEESEPIIFDIVYLNPSNPDPNPPERLVHNRWQYIEFTDPIEFNLSNIIKSAKSSDPRSSSLAIHHNDQNDEIFIWGLVDQGNQYHDYVNYESE